MSIDAGVLKAHFAEALAQLDPAARAAYLDSACRGNPELRAAVEALLQAHDQAGDFLEPTAAAFVPPEGLERPGTVIGRYKLLQQIGEGGFGVVYMAEQVEPVRRKVALKIIKAGMDTREVIARFEAERQALALMDHPNIAQVFDGGITGAPQLEGSTSNAQRPTLSAHLGLGRPYFVMELVKGIPLTEYCDEAQLPTEERLRLFIKVCHALQHAHQKGVIHRDLKPSNILVTLQDGEAIPKVIDFGVAKALGQQLTDKTYFTRFEQVLGTPAYMSPEQAALSAVDVDTRSDIYGLGVLLYELLTGTTPVERETLRRAAFDELRRLIRETDPPKPSTRLQSLGPRLTEVAARRHVEPSLLPRQVRGDLDWIVMKALEKDRQRRYESAAAFAVDIERHLNHEPVVACPPTRAYRARKFLRRNRVAVSVAAVVSLAVAVGAVLALVGLVTARQERNRAVAAEQRARASAQQAETSAKSAETEAAVSKAVLEFLQKDLLGQASPTQNPDRDLKLRTALDRTADTVGARFTNQPLVEAAVRHTLGNVYRALGEVKLAETQLRRAIELRHRVAGTNDHEAFHWQGLLALALIEQGGPGPGRAAEAERLIQALFEECARQQHPGSDAWDLLHNLAVAAEANGRTVEALQTMERLMATERKWTNVSAQRLIPSRDVLAALYSKVGRWWEAELEQRAVLELERATHGPEHPGTLTSINNLVITLDSLGRYEEALALLSESQPIRRRVLGAQHPNTITSLKNLAALHGSLGDWPECYRLYRELMELFRASLDDAHVAVTAAWLAGETNWARQCLKVVETELANVPNPQAGRLLACAALATPEVTTNLGPVFQAAEAAYQDQPTLPINILFRGETDYRRGRWAEALRRLEPLRRDPHGLLAVEAGCFVAMAHQQQGQTTEAKTALDAASRRLDSFLRAGRFGTLLDRSDRWHEVGRVALLRAEAEHLIHSHIVSPPLDAKCAAEARQRWDPVREAMIAAFQCAGQQKWSEARDAWLRAWAEPGFAWDTALEFESDLAVKMGMTFLRAHDRTNHARLCRTLLALADKTSNPVTRFSTALVALVDAEAQELHQPAAEAIAAASREDSHPDLAPWMGLVAGLANYRAGEYTRAIAALDACEASDRPWCKGPALAYQALALQQLGRTEDARQSLSRARELLAEPLKDRLIDWHHWAMLEMAQWALDEATVAVPSQKP